jgi:hypothetical protein
MARNGRSDSGYQFLPPPTLRSCRFILLGQPQFPDGRQSGSRPVNDHKAFLSTDPTANIHVQDRALRPIETFIMLTVVLFWCIALAAANSKSFS